MPLAVAASLALMFLCMFYVSRASDFVLEVLQYGINLGISMAMIAEIWF